MTQRFDNFLFINEHDDDDDDDDDASAIAFCLLRRLRSSRSLRILLAYFFCVAASSTSIASKSTVYAWDGPCIVCVLLMLKPRMGMCLPAISDILPFCSNLRQCLMVMTTE